MSDLSKFTTAELAAEIERRRALEIERRLGSPLPCRICGKQKDQPPDRCNGHYAGTASDPNPKGATV